MKPTRQQYMNNQCTFAEYYRAINKTAGVKITNPEFIGRVRAALANGDEHLNTIPLQVWDNRAVIHASALARAFKAHGDFYSLAGGVCAMKQAARDAVELGINGKPQP